MKIIETNKIKDNAEAYDIIADVPDTFLLKKVWTEQKKSHEENVPEDPKYI